MQSNCCAKCKLEFGYLRWASICPGCHLNFRSKCLNYSLVTEKDIESQKITTFCKGCYKIHSSLDHSVGYEIHGRAKDQAPSLMFVHSAGTYRFNVLNLGSILFRMSKFFRQSIAVYSWINQDMAAVWKTC
jgi:hypothetical protein